MLVSLSSLVPPSEESQGTKRNKKKQLKKFSKTGENIQAEE